MGVAFKTVRAAAVAGTAIVYAFPVASTQAWHRRSHLKKVISSISSSPRLNAARRVATVRRTELCCCSCRAPRLARHSSSCCFQVLAGC
jgi:hypothetical protein